MKIFVIGAHGQIGQLLVETLLDNDYEVVGGYRDPAQQAPEGTRGEFSAVGFNLDEPIAEMAKAMKGCAAVVFAAGSRGQALLSVDLDGAVKSMAAAKKAGISRFIQLSALGADDRKTWAPSLHDYYIAKYYADEWLKHMTELDYVIVAPTTLTNDDATGKITLEPKGQTTVTRGDVASVLAEVIESTHHRETLKLANGSVPIAQAI